MPSSAEASTTAYASSRWRSLVGEVAQRAAARALHLGDEHVALLVLPHDVGPDSASACAFGFFASRRSLLELAAHRFELPRAAFEQRPRLARGHRLDAARAGADRPLAA